MPSSGVFIVLYDEETLTLYIDRGVYGFLMSPVGEVIAPQSRHFNALGDYACVREGTHIFFFWKRHIVYGGQAIGGRDTGAFFLNGQLSPMGIANNAPLCWDESNRPGYVPTNLPGLFSVPDANGSDKEKCQPYLIRFRDNSGLKGRWIRSDDLYWRLGDYGYPLPSNAIQGMSFCTLTPREMDIALSLLRGSVRQFPIQSQETIQLNGEPLQFAPNHSVQDLAEAFQEHLFTNEAHLETSVIANPTLLPTEMRPNSGDTICRQVPVSPFKPAQMDRADICYYSAEAIKDGTIPNVLIELKNVQAGQSAVGQVDRYLEWFYRIAPNEASAIRVYVFAPSFSRRVRVNTYPDQITLMTPNGRFVP